MKQFVNPFDYAGEICKAMKKGILLTTKAHGQVNTMTIGWGTIGVQWGRPIFIAYVRDSRYTKQLLDETGEFTVNIPVGDLEDCIRRGAKGLLKEVALFDIYTGLGIPAGKKSVAFSLTLRADERSLTAQEADEDVQGILALLEREYQAVLR